MASRIKNAPSNKKKKVKFKAVKRGVNHEIKVFDSAGIILPMADEEDIRSIIYRPHNNLQGILTINNEKRSPRIISKPTTSTSDQTPKRVVSNDDIVVQIRPRMPTQGQPNINYEPIKVSQNKNVSSNNRRVNPQEMQKKTASTNSDLPVISKRTQNQSFSSLPTMSQRPIQRQIERQPNSIDDVLKRTSYFGYVDTHTSTTPEQLSSNNNQQIYSNRNNSTYNVTSYPEYDESDDISFDGEDDDVARYEEEKEDQYTDNDDFNNSTTSTYKIPIQPQVNNSKRNNGRVSKAESSSTSSRSAFKRSSARAKTNTNSEDNTYKIWMLYSDPNNNNTLYQNNILYSDFDTILVINATDIQKAAKIYTKEQMKIYKDIDLFDSYIIVVVYNEKFQRAICYKIYKNRSTDNNGINKLIVERILMVLYIPYENALKYPWSLDNQNLSNEQRTVYFK